MLYESARFRDNIQNKDFRRKGVYICVFSQKTQKPLALDMGIS